MILDDATSFWWENITGPQMLISKLAECLLDGKNVILQMDGGLSWGEQIRDFVAHHMEQVRLQPLRWSSGKTQTQIVPNLLEQLRQNESASCPMDYKAQLTYLRDEGIFANCVVWIVPEESGDQTALLRFLSDYRGKGMKNHGAFVLEISDQQNIPSSKSVVLRCNEYIRSGDLLLYANILADHVQRNPRLKNYMACAATNLAGQNVELIPEIIKRVNFEKEDPAEALACMWDEGIIPYPDQRPGEQELQMRVWRAQLQSAFALIEMERLHIAGENKERIEQALSTEYWDMKQSRSGFIQQRGDELESAFDVELGTLVWMMSLWRNDDRTKHLLFFPEQELRSRIVFLTECRNNLAHHRVCTPEQMYGILSSPQSS